VMTAVATTVKTRPPTRPTATTVHVDRWLRKPSWPFADDAIRPT
jgi:hypothetical protein